MYKIVVFVPNEHKEQVKSAMFKAGAGKVGNYDKVCFETPGVGQFRPCEGSTPFMGQESEISRIKEVKIEMVCSEELLDHVIHAIEKSHPYETPAFDIIRTCKR